MALSLRDRFFTPPVARAFTSPTGILALGAGYPKGAADDETGRINDSEIHIDFMIGGPEVTVFAVDAQGHERPLLEGGAWRD